MIHLLEPPGPIVSDIVAPQIQSVLQPDAVQNITESGRPVDPLPGPLSADQGKANLGQRLPLGRPPKVGQVVNGTIAVTVVVKVISEVLGDIVNAA